MNDNKFPYLILDQNKSQSEDDSDFSENEYKRKNFKIQKYEKFKPKQANNNDKNNKSLKGAENKVKNLLSLFLKNMESEADNSGSVYKSINTIKNKDKDKDSISIKKCKLKKINTTKNDYLIRTSSFNMIINNENKINAYKNFENNNLYHDEQTPKSNYSKIFHPKKIGFNIIHNSNKDFSKETNHFIKMQTKKKNSLKISSTLKNKGMNIRVIRTKSYNTENPKKHKISSFAENIKGNIIIGKKKDKSLLKKTKSYGQNHYLNFKNEGFILNKNNNDVKKKKKGILKNFIHHKNVQTKKNNILNESSVLSENSDNNINKRSIEIKPIDKNSLILLDVKKSSTVIKNDFSFLSNKNSIDLTDLSNKNSSIKNSIVKNTVKPKKKVFDLKNSLDIKKFKRSETSILENNNQFMRKSKYHRLNTHFKSLKEQLKKSLILRPEEIKSIKPEDDKSNASGSIVKKKNILNKKRNSTNLNYNNFNFNIYKNKQSSKSNKVLIKIKKDINDINFGLISKPEIKKKHSSNIDIRFKDFNKIPEIKTTAQKLTTETESHETTKTEKKESSKSVSSEEYSVNSIQRKKTIYIEKYRILTHKGIVYDSLDDEEFEDQEDINSLYLDPNSIFSIIFDSLLFIVTILSFCEVPLYLALNHDFCKREKFTYADGINFFIECLNIIDLFLGFFRAYYNWEEQLISKNRVIARKYLTGWFLFDLVASVPIYTIFKMYEPQCNTKELSTKYYNIVLDKIHYLFIGNRLIKALKIFYDNQAWKILSNKLNDNSLMIVNIFLVLAALNYTACLYIFIARNTYPNWILQTKLETRPFIDIYICAIYILIMALTTVGYGDITCYSFAERIFQLLLLIIGIMAYSWLISSFSNYIKKINEMSADFETKKSILDEIKVNNPNLPDELYDRILRYLKFKNFQEKKLKDIIFDCLPVGLKNNLISEMYKPIIQNFIFFKNFQNTDFIVRVILSFKSILAYKNDILVNEGDMVEDIMFVKRGMLTVELPINMTNPQENIYKYLDMPLLKIEKGPNVQKIGNSTILPGKDPRYKNMINSINNDSRHLNSSNLNSMKNISTFGSRINSYKSNSSFDNKTTLKKKKTLKIQTTYVKILGIRENEHFGDVLMFLEQRSPLRVRVRSKKSELFFLKKMDAVKISTSYPNIWRRINKKSVFNFEQIKKSIRKIVEIYCSVKKVDTDSEEELSDDDKEFGIKESGIGLHPQNYDLNNSCLKSKKNLDLRKIQSLKDKEIKDYNRIFVNGNIDEDYFEINDKKINEKKRRSLSPRILKKKFELITNNGNQLDLSSSSSSSSSIPSPKIKSNRKILQNKKLMDVFQGNYKFYKKSNKNNDFRQNTIISEEPEKESTITPLKYTNSIQKMKKISTIKMKKKIISTMTIGKKYENEINCINENENEEEEFKNISYKKKESSRSSDSNKEKDNNIDKKEMISSSYEKEINIEIYPGETIELNKEENLLYKKVNYNVKENYNNFNNKKFEYKNTKLEKLLESFDEECKSPNKKNKDLISKDISNQNLIDLKDSPKENNKIAIGDGILNNICCDNKNNELNIKSNLSSNSIPSPIHTPKRPNWDSVILTINSDISLSIESSYENFNIISGDRLIKNKSLQTKLKNYLIDETAHFSRFKTNNSLIKKTNSLAEPLKANKNKNLFQSQIKPNKRLNSSIVYNTKNFNAMQLLKKKTKKIRRSSSTLSRRSKTINSNYQNFDRTSSFYENTVAKNKKSTNKFQTGIGSELIGNTFLMNKLGKKKLGLSGQSLRNVNNNLSKLAHISSFNNLSNANNSSQDLPKKFNRKRRNSLIIVNNNKNKKSKDNLLSLINLNIQKTNQNLNNPDEFYSNYFNFLLEGEIEKNNQKGNINGQKSEFFTTSVMELPRVKKEKIMRNRSSVKK